MKCEYMSPQNVLEGIFENISFRGRLFPKNLKIEWVKQVLYPDEPTAQGCTAERCHSLHIVVQRPGTVSEVGQLFCMTYDFRPTAYGASNFHNFLNFCLFFPFKTPKSTFLYVAYSPGVTLQNASIYYAPA